MADLASRFESNPLICPQDVPPSRDGVGVLCVLNPGAFRYQGKTGLLLRVAERPHQTEEYITTPVIDSDDPSGMSILSFRKDDPKLSYGDPRGFTYEGQNYLTTLSHLRLAWSDDGENFTVDPKPTLIGQGELETFGVEDARVTEIDGVFHITYTQVSERGFGVGLITTADWRTYERQGMILPPYNKDCAFFPEKIGGEYVALHRPSGGVHNIWIGGSPDGRHWGGHACLAAARPGAWDEQRIGCGAAPIRTDAGWLEIYHGANHDQRYCLGALLLDLDDPRKVLARSAEPIMEPIAPYEQRGFLGNVVFTNGHVVDGDTITAYYGASDEIVCGARLSIREILATLG
ncbi:glycosidase [Capsulimonas corticalis]|uniref:Glycosidase n=1 Tax=Capsulimonas corticalis TaxID=2219043 RepID=A0A402D6A3_9BACT|nr:glycoside hydrolase family 130 protein [Capsulimonas corticalis]BDI32056.1 glycosidase [Capsulimonas corticalis]